MAASIRFSIRQSFPFENLCNGIFLRRLSSKSKQIKKEITGGPLNYCQELVRKNDYENFLATLLLPPGSRESTIAVRAFNVSVAQIQDQVSQELIGQMKMKFWIDTIESLYKDNPPAQPVAQQLHKAVNQHKLTKRWFLRLISSREENLHQKSFATLADAETYAENSVSSILYLTLECINVRNVHSDHAASHIGRAQGLITLLRAIPFNAQRNKVYIPIDMLVKHKVSQQDILKGSPSVKVKDLVFDIASSANAHIEKARAIGKDVPSEAKVALLPLVCAVQYLENLRKADFNAFDGKLLQRNPLLPWKLWWTKFSNKL